MAERTEIPWTKSTFNPWIGCTKVSVSGTHGAGGCDNCYAEVQDARNIFAGTTHWGPGVRRLRTSASNWNQVRRWNRDAPNTEFAGRKGFWPVFSASLGDIFDNEVPEEWRRDFWALVKECSNLTFQIVTKRIGNVAKMLPPDWGDGYPNVWLMITVVNQFEADRDIPKLLGIPSVVCGISMEPLLGPVSFRWMAGIFPEPYTAQNPTGITNHLEALRCLDWIVVGGESGPSARPMHPDWARSLREQCVEARVPFLFKQWGEWETAYQNSAGEHVFRHFDSFQTWVNKASTWVRGGICLDKDGREIKDGAGMMRARDEGKFPVTIMHRIGKKEAGRMLDGVLHDEFPDAA